MRRTRFPTAVRRLTAALALAFAGVGVSLGVASPAQAATYSICSATPVPAGYVVTHAYSRDPSCGAFLRYYITNDLYNGMGICSATAVPAGWVVTHAYSGDPSCSNFFRYYITRIA